MIFTDLTDKDRRDIIDYVSGKTGFLRNVVEKDWWVTSSSELYSPCPTQIICPSRAAQISANAGD